MRSSSGAVHNNPVNGTLLKCVVIKTYFRPLLTFPVRMAVTVLQIVVVTAAAQLVQTKIGDFQNEPRVHHAIR